MFHCFCFLCLWFDFFVRCFLRVFVCVCVVLLLSASLCNTLRVYMCVCVHFQAIFPTFLTTQAVKPTRYGSPIFDLRCLVAWARVLCLLRVSFCGSPCVATDNVPPFLESCCHAIARSPSRSRAPWGSSHRGSAVAYSPHTRARVRWLSLLLLSSMHGWHAPMS